MISSLSILFFFSLFLLEKPTFKGRSEEVCEVGMKGILLFAKPIAS
jgi:hypothetical protein